MDYTVMILQFVLSLSLLVVLHELGHFLPARWFRTKVEKFYLFFDPGFSLFSKKIGDTEYGIGWLPLGGYVKIAGMIDESMDKEQMEGPPQPWEFRSKPTWQRLIIMLGGVTVNFILGFFLFAMILWWWGEQYVPANQVEHGIYVDSLAYDMGLRNGDKIISINGQPFDEFEPKKLVMSVVLEDQSVVEVERDGRRQNVEIDPAFAKKLASREYAGTVLFTARTYAEVKEVMEGSPAEKAGIQPGDRFIGVNGQSTPYLDQVMTGFDKTPNARISLDLLRSSDTLNLSFVTSDQGTIGVYWMMPMDLFDVETRRYGFFESLPMGVSRGYKFLEDQIVAFGKMFSGEIKASENLGGFGTITKLFPDTWDWQRFWRITAILSLILGFMNLLPIPALDGGHVMFLLWEMITGRKPSDKFMEYATILGFAIVMGLVLYANGLDVYRWLTGK
jgi:regulator of sigma E protease